MAFDYMSPKLRERLKNQRASSYDEKIASVRNAVNSFSASFPDRKIRIADLGCGEDPLFEGSDNVDIYPAKGCVVADLNKEMPLKENTYDVVLAIDVIEHLYDVDTFVKNCHKILRTGGLLIVSTPNVLYWRNRIELFLGSDRHFDHEGEHLHFFSFRSLLKLLKKHGFEETPKTIIPIGVSKLIPSMAGGFIAVVRKAKQ